MPGSLAESLKALEKDHEFLKKGGVFTDNLIDAYITYKVEKEIEPSSLRPHPFEFYLYYDC